MLFVERETNKQIPDIKILIASSVESKKSMCSMSIEHLYLRKKCKKKYLQNITQKTKWRNSFQAHEILYRKNIYYRIEGMLK